MTLHLLIVGCSVRSAAQSAHRAGWNVCAIDQFADQDLRSICPTEQVTDYPQGLISLARQFPSCPFLYTGALENHPEVLAALARERPLLGNGPEIVRRLRDPSTLADHLAETGLRFPRILRAGERRPAGDWLRKPFKSGGGVGIQRVRGVDEISFPSRRTATREESTHYYQEFIPGTAISGQFVAADGKAILLGITKQLSGCDWSGASEFLYVGNIAPLSVGAEVSDLLRRVGEYLAANFRLTGLFGIDAILRTNVMGAAEVWGLEVNPRFTSAIELLERACGFSAIHTHIRACEGDYNGMTVLPTGSSHHAKAVVYARHQVIIPVQFADWTVELNQPSQPQRVADIPSIGSTVLPGQPICTVFSTGDNEADAESSLKALAKWVYSVVEEDWRNSTLL